MEGYPRIFDFAPSSDQGGAAPTDSSPEQQQPDVNNPTTASNNTESPAQVSDTQQTADAQPSIQPPPATSQDTQPAPQKQADTVVTPTFEKPKLKENAWADEKQQISTELGVLADVLYDHITPEARTETIALKPISRVDLALMSVGHIPPSTEEFKSARIAVTKQIVLHHERLFLAFIKTEFRDDTEKLEKAKAALETARQNSADLPQEYDDLITNNASKILIILDQLEKVGDTSIETVQQTQILPYVEAYRKDRKMKESYKIILDIMQPLAMGTTTSFIRQNLGILADVLFDHCTPAARKSSKEAKPIKVITRADLLLMAGGLIPPNVQGFRESRKLFARSIIQHNDAFAKSYLSSRKVDVEKLSAEEYEFEKLKLLTELNKNHGSILVAFDHFEHVDNPITHPENDDMWNTSSISEFHRCISLSHTFNEPIETETLRREMFSAIDDNEIKKYSGIYSDMNSKIEPILINMANIGGGVFSLFGSERTGIHQYIERAEKRFGIYDFLTDAKSLDRIQGVGYSLQTLMENPKEREELFESISRLFYVTTSTTPQPLHSIIELVGKEGRYDGTSVQIPISTIAKLFKDMQAKLSIFTSSDNGTTPWPLNQFGHDIEAFAASPIFAKITELAQADPKQIVQQQLVIQLQQYFLRDNSSYLQSRYNGFQIPTLMTAAVEAFVAQQKLTTEQIVTLLQDVFELTSNPAQIKEHKPDSLSASLYNIIQQEVTNEISKNPKLEPPPLSIDTINLTAPIPWETLFQKHNLPIELRERLTKQTTPLSKIVLAMTENALITQGYADTIQTLVFMIEVSKYLEHDINIVESVTGKTKIQYTKKDGKIFQPDSQGLRIHRAIKPSAWTRAIAEYKSMRQRLSFRELLILYNPQSFSQYDTNIRYTGATNTKDITTRISDEKEVMQQRHQESLETITPIDFELKPETRVALIVGPNGSGKTWLEETIAQKIIQTNQIGVSDATGEYQGPVVARLSTLINASVHTESASTFQNHIDAIEQALRELNRRRGGGQFIFIVDEIGRGTDSREAIALLTAVAQELISQPNTTLIVSTHHAVDFVDLAKEIGIWEKCQMFYPDPETHEIKETTEVVPSYGIEMMGKMAVRENINDNPVMQQIITNAFTIRDRLRSGEAIDISNILVSEATSSINPEKAREISALSNGSIKMVLPDLGLSSLCGIQKTEKGYMQSSDQTAWEFISTPLSEIEDYAVRSLEDPSISLQELEERKLKIEEIITLINSADKKIDISSVFAEQATLVELFTHALPQDIGLMLEAIESSFRKATNPIESSNIRYDTERQLKSLEFYRQVINKDVLTTLSTSIETISKLYSGLPETSPIRTSLDLMTERLRGVASAYQEIESKEINSLYEQAFLQDSAIKLADYVALHFDQLTRENPGWFTALRSDLGNQISDNTYNLRTTLRQGIQTDYDRTTVINAIRNMLKNQEKNALPTDLLSDISKTEKLEQEITLLFSQPNINFNSVRQDLGIAQEIPDLDIKAVLIRGCQLGDYTKLHKLLQFISRIPDFEKNQSKYRLLSDLNKNVRVAVDYAVLSKWNKFIANPSAITLENVDIHERYGIDLSDTSEAQVARVKSLQVDPVTKKAIVELLTSPEAKASYQLLRIRRDVLNLYSTQRAVDLIRKYGMIIPQISTDGRLVIKGGVDPYLRARVDKGGTGISGLSNYIPLDIELNGNTDLTVIGGLNGGGKTQAILTLEFALRCMRNLGRVCATEAILPQTSFQVIKVNSAESQETQSSFQNEISQYINIIKGYLEAGAPKDGIILLDEPLGSTSSEDQISIMTSIAMFFASRNVKLLFTNHNTRLYETLQQVQAENRKLTTQVLVAGNGVSQKKFTLENLPIEEASEIRSEGINVAEQREFGKLNQTIIDKAKYAYIMLKRLLERKKLQAKI